MPRKDKRGGLIQLTSSASQWHEGRRHWGTWKVHGNPIGLNSKRNCNAIFKGRAIPHWHEAKASHYIFNL